MSYAICLPVVMVISGEYLIQVYCNTLQPISMADGVWSSKIKIINSAVDIW
jgi:hypothetical protein